jgi:hypothetical protein
LMPPSWDWSSFLNKKQCCDKDTEINIPTLGIQQLFEDPIQESAIPLASSLFQFHAGELPCIMLTL